MKNSLLLALATIAAVEISLRLPWKVRFSGIQILLNKITRLLLSKNISDHYKEKLLPVYSIRLAESSALLAVYLILLFLPYVSAAVFSTDFNSFISDLVTPWNLGVMLSASVGYLVMRSRLSK